MGAAAMGTLTTTYDVAEKWHRQMFIDLMEVSDAKLQQITSFPNAIYGLHHAKDSQENFNATDSVAKFHAVFPNIRRINVAGGIDLHQAAALKKQGLVETVIVGSKIMKAADPVAAAEEFMKVVK